MSEHENRPAWMEDELVQGIPQEKLDFLSKMYAEANEKRRSSDPAKNQRELMLRLMPLLKQAKASNLGFTPQEVQAAVTAIRKHSTPDELKQIDKILEKNNTQNNTTMRP